MNVTIQILLGAVLSFLIPVAISCVQMLITELKHMLFAKNNKSKENNK